ncbi:gpW family head-tail joining protein [Aquamicrobium zhengzhouense]|nr:gpW family head-tail joining protein [Aquamicrobium zhengzhouense]
MTTYVTQEMLNEARQARHRLLTGGGVYQFRDQNGEQVSYAKTDLPKLDAYIRWLETELGVGIPVPVMKVWM